MFRLLSGIKNQIGAIPLPLLIAVVGIIIIFLLTSVAPFKNTLLSLLYGKPPAHALGSELYIAPGGSDSSGDGTFNNPFQSINRAQNSATPGSIVYLRGGSYHSRITISSGSGTANYPVTYKPFQNEMVIFDGAGVSLSQTQGLVTLYKVNYVDFIGFEIANSSGRGILVDGSSFINIKSNKIHDVKYAAAVLDGSDITFDGNEAYNAGLSNLNGAFGSGGWPAIVGTWMKPDGSASQRINITNNKIYNSWGEGIDLIAVDGGSVRGNIVHDTFSALVYLDHARNIIVDGNYIYFQNNTFLRSGSPPNGILLAAESCCVPNPNFDDENITISNNLILGSKNGIYYWDAGTGGTFRNLKILFNDIKDSKSHGLYFENGPNTSGNELKNNIIYGDFVTSNPSSWQFANNNWPSGKPAIDNSPSSLSVDPQFIAPQSPGSYIQSADGYKLKTTSPVIAKGVSVPVTADYFSVQRPAIPTIGFFEANLAISSISPSAAPTPVTTPTPSPQSSLDTTPPLVSITSPVAGAMISRNSNITVNASASDNVGVARVEFYLNSNLKCKDTTFPFSCSFKLGGKSSTAYQLVAKSFDLAGNSSSSAISVVIK